MQQIYLYSAEITVSIEFPDSFASFIKILFPDPISQQSDQADIYFSVSENQSGLFEIAEGDESLSKNLDEKQCALELMNEVVRSVADSCQNRIAIHAAAVSKDGIAIVLPAKTGGGKTSLAAWLTAQGYEYLTDELVLYRAGKAEFDAFYRPLNIKSTGLDVLKPLQNELNSEQQIITESVVIWPAEAVGQRAQNFQSIKTGLFIFPVYMKDSELRIEPLTAAQTGLELMACNVNARNFDDHGFKGATDIARQVPGIRLLYSDFEQFEDILPKLIDLLVSGSFDIKFLADLLKVNPSQNKIEPIKSSPGSIPTASEKGNKKKLCIGMATYDDYDGVYFSIQALRLYHPEVTDDTEILVLDNHPTGKCAKDLKALDGKVKHYRYVPVMGKTGTAVIKNLIFEHTDANHVLCMDCHVLIQPGALAKLIEYFDQHHDYKDLLHGPMLHDDVKTVSTHFEPIWRGGMHGIWAYDERGKSPDLQPFEIPMQGMGLFACNRQAWPGFNQNFRGFGIEEGYIHEKFRQAGGKTLCLPFLRWMHRFARPMGVPYPINWPDRVRNYLIGFNELGLDTTPIIEHFNEHLGEDMTMRAVQAFENEFENLT